MDTRPDTHHTEQQQLLGALARVLEPVAQLCVARGVGYHSIDELLRQALVKAARQASEPTGAQPSDRLTSRISTMTGLTRREVRRLEATAAPALPTPRSLVSEVVTRWWVEPDYRDECGPLPWLRRHGAAPSFEALAASVTRDVHPRSLLAEMERLHLVTFDPVADTVTLLQDAFVPRQDWGQMMGYLGANVGDHMRAATANVLGTGSEHFEQALLADELSSESARQARDLIAEQWRRLLAQLGPPLQALMEADRAAGRACDQAVRIGLYSWTQPMAGFPNQPTAPATKAQT